jgi:predicted type IV restriction endonuclease
MNKNLRIKVHSHQFLKNNSKNQNASFIDNSNYQKSFDKYASYLLNVNLFQTHPAQIVIQTHKIHFNKRHQNKPSTTQMKFHLK